MHQTVTLQLHIRPDRRLSALVWDRKQRHQQAFNAGIAYLIEHQERDARGYRKPGLKGQGLYKELKHLLREDPAFTGMMSYDLYTGLRDAGQTYEQWRRGCNDKRKARIAHRHRLVEYREEPVHVAGPRQGQPKTAPKPPVHRYRPPETLFKSRKKRARAEQYGRRFAYPSAYKPQVRGRHRLMLPGLAEVSIRGTLEARLRDLYPGRRILDWRMLTGYQLVDITRKVTRRTRPEDWRYKLHVQVEVELPDPTPADAPMVIGCDPGVRVDLAVAGGIDEPAWAFLSPAGLKRQGDNEFDRLRSARATNTKKNSRKYRRLSRTMATRSRRRTNRTVEWERQVACQVVALADVIGMSGIDLHKLAKSAKGTRKRPGTNVAAARRRNRNLRYARPGALRDAVVARATKEGKTLHNIDPKLSGQRCAACGYTDKANRPRKNQPDFLCVSCGHRDHDDANTARNFAAAARTAWKKERGACPVPPERRGGPSGAGDALPPPWRGRPCGPEVGQQLVDRVLAEPGRRGRKPDNYRLDFVLGGPPPFENLDGSPGWSKEEIWQWAQESIAWLAKSMPDAVVEHCVLHLDEHSPHLHVVVVSYNADTDRIGWGQVRHGLAGLERDRSTHDTTILHAMHDRYHERVSARWGLARDRGATRGIRNDNVDRNQGELLRAAADGYTAAYVATAREEVKWAATEGAQLRREAAEADHWDCELLDRYCAHFEVTDVVRRPRLPDTVPLAEQLLSRQRVEFERRVAASETYHQRYMAILDDRKAMVEAGERSLAENRHALAGHVASLTRELPQLRDDGRTLLGEIVSIVHELPVKLNPLHRQHIDPLREKLGGYLQLDDRLAGLVDRLRQEVEPKPSEIDERRRWDDW